MYNTVGNFNGREISMIAQVVYQIEAFFFIISWFIYQKAYKRKDQRLFKWWVGVLAFVFSSIFGLALWDYYRRKLNKETSQQSVKTPRKITT